MDLLYPSSLEREAFLVLSFWTRRRTGRARTRNALTLGVSGFSFTAFEFFDFFGLGMSGRRH